MPTLMSFANVSSRTSLALSAAVFAAVALFALTPVAAPVPTVSSASADYFLKIDGIEGESKDTGHPKEIQIESWSWGMTNSGSGHMGGGAGAGKVSMSDLSVMKRIDKSSPLLMKACASGQHIKEAVLTARRIGPKGTDYIRYTLNDVLCTSVQDNGSSSTIPAESLSLNFTKIKVEYLPEGETRWVEFTWDLAKNTF